MKIYIKCYYSKTRTGDTISQGGSHFIISTSNNNKNPKTFGHDWQFLWTAKEVDLTRVDSVHDAHRWINDCKLEVKPRPDFVAAVKGELDGWFSCYQYFLRKSKQQA
jgi:hypothetical protein